MTHSNTKPTSVSKSILSQFATYRKAHLRARGITITLTFCCILFFSLSVPRAQVAYNFQTPDELLISTALVPLPMDCLAANGYGQWTSSPTSNGESNLLTNRLTNILVDNAQAGVLASEAFAFSGSDVYPTSDAIKSAS